MSEGPPKSLTEGTDVEATPQGKSAAVPNLAEVFRAEGRYVWNTFRRLGVRDADVKDLTQEFFLSLHRLLPGYDPSRPIRPWLFTIAYRMALRHIERTKREHLIGEPADSIDIPDPEVDLDRHLTVLEERDLILRALESVAIERRAVFVLADIDEVPIPEIALQFDIPLNTAYSRLRLARQEFRQAVQRLRKRSGHE